MRILGIIPIRTGSTRFPNKFIQMFDGDRIIDRMIDIAKKIDVIDDIIVATDDEDLGKELVKKHGITGYHVSNACCGTHRAFNVFKLISDYDYYITIPADEPAIDPVEVNKILKESTLSDGEILTFFTRFFNEKDLFSPLSCKIVEGHNYMLYNSRAVVPVAKDGALLPLEKYLKHVGIFVIPVFIFERYGNLWSYTPDTESLEQNRFLSAGIDVRLEEVKHRGFGIDVPEQIKMLEDRLHETREPIDIPDNFEICYKRLKPKIICIFRATDGGKSLLRKIFMDNFKDFIHDASADDSDAGPAKVIDRLTEKPNMLIVLQSGWFKQYGDYGINMVRDIRARWAVTQHRGDPVDDITGVEKYANEMQNAYADFKGITAEARKSKTLTIRFEDYIDDPLHWFKILADFCHLPITSEYVAPSYKYNDWFSSVDLYNIRRWVKEGDKLKQSELDYLSERFQEYNKRYGYPERLTVADLYPETLKQDIEDYNVSR